MACVRERVEAPLAEFLEQQNKFVYRLESLVDRLESLFLDGDEHTPATGQSPHGSGDEAAGLEQGNVEQGVAGPPLRQLPAAAAAEIRETLGELREFCSSFLRKGLRESLVGSGTSILGSRAAEMPGLSRSLLAARVLARARRTDDVEVGPASEATPSMPANQPQESEPHSLPENGPEQERPDSAPDRGEASSRQRRRKRRPKQAQKGAET